MRRICLRDIWVLRNRRGGIKRMKERGIDLIIAAVCITVIGIVFFYPDQVRGRGIIMATAAVLLILFLILAVRDTEDNKQTVGRLKLGLPTESELITEIVLLSEEDTELMTWDLYGKMAVVIGRDVRENQVDIDLGKSSYASMVDIEHAVLNHSSGNWYVEDLGSSNGISVKKAEDGRVYKLSADTPCRIEKGDYLYVGLNRLLLR
ncbi:MAG: FHA domain-containing protein [Hungatella sp.]|nr:FHA domain-containing protein [Hungatella sp.]